MLTIAIAEDNSAEREGLIQQVKTLGYTLVLTAVDGYDLLLQLAKLPTNKLPNILLLDMNMPKINGLLVTTYCTYKYPSLKIIAVSSHTNDALITEVITEGASAFITKYFLTPNAFIYTDNYGSTNTLQMAIKALQNEQLFIDKLLVNNPESITRNVSTNAIVATKFQHLKPIHREFAILNASGLSLSEVAALMHISVNTIKDYNILLCKQFAVKNHHQLAQACFAYGIVKQAVYYDHTMSN